MNRSIPVAGWLQRKIGRVSVKADGDAPSLTKIISYSHGVHRSCGMIRRTRRRQKMRVVSTCIAYGLQTFLEYLRPGNERLVEMLGMGRFNQGVRPRRQKVNHVIADAPIAISLKDLPQEFQSFRMAGIEGVDGLAVIFGRVVQPVAPRGHVHHRLLSVRLLEKGV